MIPIHESLTQIYQHAQEKCPRESCGLLVETSEGQVYMAGENISKHDPSVDRFQLGPEIWPKAETLGKVVAVVHSHPYGAPDPSEADLYGCSASKLPWLIMGYPTGKYRVIYPETKVLPLEGRPFSHGVVDCFTLIRDYYKMVLDIELPDFSRGDDWWAKGENLYLENYAAAGFDIEKGPLQKHDVILMALKANVPNHGGIYLGDGVILHHVMKRLSRREAYDGMWRKITTHVVRHRSLQ